MRLSVLCMALSSLFAAECSMSMKKKVVCAKILLDDAYCIQRVNNDIPQLFKSTTEIMGKEIFEALALSERDKSTLQQELHGPCLMENTTRVKFNLQDRPFAVDIIPFDHSTHKFIVQISEINKDTQILESLSQQEK